MRKTYKFRHSVFQGGFLYAHKTANNSRIDDKEGLRSALEEIMKKFGLIDATIKIYDNIFFLFFLHKRTTKPIDLINEIQENTKMFGSWHQDYIFTTVYDLQEEYVRKDIKKFGFDYDQG